MYLAIGIERQPVSNERQPVREIERAKVRTRIVARVFDIGCSTDKLKKLLRNVCRVTGEWPSPPNMDVRSKPNSRFGVGLKLTFSTSTQGSPGLITFGYAGEGFAWYCGYGISVCPRSAPTMNS